MTHKTNIAEETADARREKAQYLDLIARVREPRTLPSTAPGQACSGAGKEKALGCH